MRLPCAVCFISHHWYTEIRGGNRHKLVPLRDFDRDRDVRITSDHKMNVLLRNTFEATSLVLEPRTE